MTGAVRTEGHVAGLDRIRLLTVVIRAFTAQDVIGLGLAVVLVEAERAVRLDRYLGVQAALSVQLFLAQQVLDDNVSLAASHLLYLIYLMFACSRNHNSFRLSCPGQYRMIEAAVLPLPLAQFLVNSYYSGCNPNYKIRFPFPRRIYFAVIPYTGKPIRTLN